MEVNYGDLQMWWRQYAHCYEKRSWLDYRPLLAEVIHYSLGGPLVDVGCGYGFLIECARQFGIPAIGLEGAEPALVAGRQRHPQADIRAWQAGTPLDLPANFAGAVTLNEVIDHISLEHNRQLFTDIHKTLRPGGVVIIKSPAKYNRFDKDTGHVTFFTPSEFRSFLESLRFEILTQPYVPQPLLGKSRLGWFAMRVVAKFLKPAKWAARIDSVARKPLA
jgi:SAM-dependent methyltransferase